MQCTLLRPGWLGIRNSTIFIVTKSKLINATTTRKFIEYWIWLHKEEAIVQNLLDAFESLLILILATLQFLCQIWLSNIYWYAFPPRSLWDIFVLYDYCKNSPALIGIVIANNKLMSVFHASVLLLTMNFIITLSNWVVCGSTLAINQFSL